MKNKVSELGNEFMNIDGDVLNYEVANGFQNIGNNFHENGLSNTDMSYAGGDVDDDFFGADGEDDFYGYGGDNDGDADDYYNAGGLFKNYRKQQSERQKRRTERSKSKNEARKMRGEASKTRADAKVGMSEAQKLSAKASEKGVEGDVALANALAKNQPEESKGLSLGAKVGIGAGIVLVLGVVGYFIYKKMKKGK